MNTNIELYEPWKKVLLNEIEALYSEVLIIEREKHFCLFELKPLDSSKSSEETFAEKYGRRIKQRFNFYLAFLNLIKSECNWIVFVRHRLSNTSYNDEYKIINNEQIIAYYFDALAFNFKWWDNTLDRPFTPWNWKIDLIPQDLDDTHLFYCRNKNWLLRSSLNFNNEIPTFEIFNQNFSEKIAQSLKKWLIAKS